jgi:hypothetical protein
MSNNYLPVEKATTIRVFQEGDNWVIDAINEEGDYIEEVWTDWNNLPLDKETAILHADDFAQHIGRKDLVGKLEVS